jgi:hypothetical protein
MASSVTGQRAPEILRDGTGSGAAREPARSRPADGDAVRVRVRRRDDADHGAARRVEDIDCAEAGDSDRPVAGRAGVEATRARHQRRAEAGAGHGGQGLERPPEAAVRGEELDATGAFAAEHARARRPDGEVGARGRERVAELGARLVPGIVDDAEQLAARARCGDEDGEQEQAGGKTTKRGEDVHAPRILPAHILRFAAGAAARA